MDLESMGKEELIEYIKKMKQDLENVIVFWGDKRDYRETFREVARNEEGEYTQEESRNAEIILGSEAAFEDFIQLVRGSFERGGINYAISEKISALMQEAASRHGGDHRHN